VSITHNVPVGFISSGCLGASIGLKSSDVFKEGDRSVCSKNPL
jgi:hypothetical protein